MDLNDFDFELPEDRIALRPARPRDAARLLHVLQDGRLEDALVRDLPALLRPDDVLVFNDTKVSPAALSGMRPKRDELGEDVAVGVNLLRQTGPDIWSAYARPGRRLREGDVIAFAGGLEAEVAGKTEGAEILLRFNRAGAALYESFAAAGAAPLPPYIARRRAPDAKDLEDYQTMFARVDGAAAAPTAGLHFTPELVAALDARGIGRETVTLTVGAGTFAPLDEEALARGTLHPESAVLTGETAERLNSARAAGRRIVATGTTTLRVLESAADAQRRFASFQGETDIFIKPGYVFRGVDALMTNFHLPRSSLFLLVCAFAGVETMKRAYDHAISSGYRFYSYGDACLLEGRPEKWRPVFREDGPTEQ